MENLMSVTAIPQLTYHGELLDMSSASVGELHRSDDALDDREELHRRMMRDGYLFLPGLLNRDEVRAAHEEVCRRLAARGVLDERHPVNEAVLAAGKTVNPAATGPMMPGLAQDNPALDRVIYAGPMIEFYEFFLNGPVRHFDYTWFRAKPPGVTTPTTPHYDIVYMGRGTHQLYTSWTPLQDVPYEMGGLMVLENSHCLEEIKRSYGQTDVDVYCENEGEATEIVARARAENRELTGEERNRIRWNSTGAFSSDAIATREQLGGRWLTAEYATGDVLIFCMYLMHAGSDNQTNRIRFSTDTRYQLASEPIDDRWIGDDPPLHGIRAKRGMVC